MNNFFFFFWKNISLLNFIVKFGCKVFVCLCVCTIISVCIQIIDLIALFCWCCHFSHSRVCVLGAMVSAATRKSAQEARLHRRFLQLPEIWTTPQHCAQFPYTVSTSWRTTLFPRSIFQGAMVFGKFNFCKFYGFLFKLFKSVIDKTVASSVSMRQTKVHVNRFMFWIPFFFFCLETIFFFC